MEIAARLSEAGKEYKTGESTIVALKPTTIEFRTGEFTLLVGPSGSGKTTLLSLLGSAIYPTTGKVWAGNTCVNNISERELASWRLHDIGFFFQGLNIIAPLNDIEYVMESLLLQGLKRKEANRRATELIKRSGKQDSIINLPRNLSGGQQQRIA